MPPAASGGDSGPPVTAADKPAHAAAAGEGQPQKPAAAAPAEKSKAELKAERRAKQASWRASGSRALVLAGVSSTICCTNDV